MKITLLVLKTDRTGLTRDSPKINTHANSLKRRPVFETTIFQK